jgi:1,2-diacylglycerol 3-alpha-glucosyltransferase
VSARIILLATPDLAYPSGSTIFVTQFATGLARRGHEVHVLCGSVPEGNDQEARLTYHALEMPIDHPVQLDPPVSSGNLERAICAYVRAASDLLVPQTILHSMYATVTAMAGACVAQRAGIPHVVTTFGRDLGVGSTDERYAAMVAKTLASATYVVAANAAVAKQAAPMLRKRNSRLTQIPMGVDDSLFRDPPSLVESRHRIGIDPSRSVVLAVQSSFGEDKRLEIVLKALAELDDLGALLLVVGRDDSLDCHRERSLRRLAARRGVSDRVIWAGQQPHSQLPFYYGAADVLADARATSSFSSCILEAMWASTPVVATSASAASGTVPPDLLADVVPTDDTARLAKALSSILDDKRRSMALGRAGQRWLTVHGSPNSIGGVVEAYGKVYRHALSSGAAV